MITMPKLGVMTVSLIHVMYWCPLSLVVSGFASTSITSSRPATFVSPHDASIRQQHPNIILHQASTATTAAQTNTPNPITIPNEWKGEILKGLSTIIDPDLSRDIVTLGFIQNLTLDPSTRQIAFEVELTTPACPIKEELQTQCQTAANSLPWTNRNAHVTMTSSPPPTNPAPGETSGVPHGLSQVRSVIAVSSCKGGVGKSTTAVNLAYALSSQGASVGIFDADVYGPSLPTMIKPDNDDVVFVGRQIAPLQRNGVKLMSFGYVNEGSAIMRGPMVTQLLDQFLSLTYWGSLDYLILDMPPGTGDIQLTLSQRVNITAAVVVTTPQELSFVDVERGIEMFDAVNVPCVAVVENMAYLDLDEDKDEDDAEEKAQKEEEEVIRLQNEIKMRQAFEYSLQEKGIPTTSIDGITDDLMKIVQASSTEDAARATNADEKKKDKKNQQLRIFGNGHRKRLSEQWGIDQTYQVPLLQKISRNGDSGTPFILDYPSSPQAGIYRDLASNVIREVAKIQYFQESARPTVSFNKETKLLDVDTGAVGSTFGRDKEDGNIGRVRGTLRPRRLRLDCKCAACVEELSGRQILKPSDVSEMIRPLKMGPTGNYALSVDWSDGHRSLYPFRQIRALMVEDEEERKRRVEATPVGGKTGVVVSGPEPSVAEEREPMSVGMF